MRGSQGGKPLRGAMGGYGLIVAPLGVRQEFMAEVASAKVRTPQKGHTRAPTH